MIYIDYMKMNESLKIHILSVAVGSSVVIDSLLETIDKHLAILENLNIESHNAQLHYNCSLDIINKSFAALCYINYHSVDPLKEKTVDLLRDKLNYIDERFSNALKRIKSEVPIIE